MAGSRHTMQQGFSWVWLQPEKRGEICECLWKTFSILEEKYIFYRLETPPFTQTACCLEPSLVLSFNGGKNNAVSCHRSGKMFELAPGKWFHLLPYPCSKGPLRRSEVSETLAITQNLLLRAAGRWGKLLRKWWHFARKLKFLWAFPFCKWNVSSICKQAGSMAVQKLLHQLLLSVFVSVLQELRTRVRSKQSEFLVSSKQEIRTS